MEADTTLHSEGILEMVSLDLSLKDEVTARAVAAGKAGGGGLPH